jgi:hypothetical protein
MSPSDNKDHHQQLLPEILASSSLTALEFVKLDHPSSRNSGEIYYLRISCVNAHGPLVVHNLKTWMILRKGI